jgi:Protein of unknown function (DUF732)
MIRHPRISALVAAVVAVMGMASGVGAGVAGATPAPVTPDDQRFAEAVAALGIPAGPDIDLPAVGHRICDMLTSGRASNINPVPTVRGVVNVLENTGMKRGQAIGLMRASVAIYCPQHAGVVGR